MKRYILIFLCCFAAIEVLGQIFDIENNSMRINQLDSLGNKSGIWVEDDLIKYYTDGKFNGPILDFEKNKEDSFLHIKGGVQYRNGIPTGPYIYFHPNGIIGFLIVKFLPNTDFVGVQKFYTPDSNFPYQAYCYDFYPNGNLKAKGWEIFGEDFEIDSERVGVWQYYDLDSNEETVDFSKDDVKYSRCE